VLCAWLDVGYWDRGGRGDPAHPSAEIARVRPPWSCLLAPAPFREQATRGPEFSNVGGRTRRANNPGTERRPGPGARFPAIGDKQMAKVELRARFKTCQRPVGRFRISQKPGPSRAPVRRDQVRSVCRRLVLQRRFAPLAPKPGRNEVGTRCSVRRIEELLPSETPRLEASARQVPL